MRELFHDGPFIFRADGDNDMEAFAAGCLEKGIQAEAFEEGAKFFRG